jgi:outer membrane receptor for ferrienterochelin and colicins
VLANFVIENTWAQPIDKRYNLDELIVTGQYEETSLSKSVYKVKIIDSKRIQAQGAFNLQQVLANELNVRIIQDPMLGSSIKLQGVGGNNIKILIDGVPVTGRESGNIDLTQINMNNVDRIELVEGPMSVNFGTDALGGVINIITKKSDKNQKQFTAGTYTESIGQYNFDAGMKLSKNRTSGQLFFGRNFFAGYSEDPNSRTKLWKPRTQYNANFDLNYSIPLGMIRWNNLFFTEKMTNKGEAEIDWTKATAQDQYYYTNRLSSTVFIDIKPEKKRNLNIILSYNFYRRMMQTYLKDLVSLEQKPIPSTEAQDTTQFHNLMSRGTYSNTFFSSKLAYQLGYELNHEIAFGSKLPETKNMGEYSVFASIEIKPTQRLLIRPACRISYHSIYTAPIIPSINLKYDLHSNLVFRASYGKGFRAPGMKELFLQFADLNHNILGNPDLKPEKSDNVQLFLCFDHKAENRVFRFEPSFFYNHINDMIGLARVGTGNQTGFKYFNLNSYQSIGLNVNTEYRRPNYSVSLGYAYTGNKNNFDNSSSSNKYYFNNEGRVNLTYNFIEKHLSLSLFCKLNGKFQSYQFVPETNSTILTYINPYSILDISASKSILKQKLQISLGLKNLSNLRNVNASFASGPHNSMSNSAMMGMGRSLFLTLRYNFNKSNS